MTCPTNSNSKENFLKTLRDNYLALHISSPTRARNESNPSLLDLIISRDDNTISTISLLSALGKSDHSLIEFTLNTESETGTRVFKDYNGADFAHMEEMLNIDW